MKFISLFYIQYNEMYTCLRPQINRIRKNVKRKVTKKSITLHSRDITKKYLTHLMKMMDVIENGAGNPVEKNLYCPTYGIKGRLWPNYPPLTMPHITKRDVRTWSIQEVGHFVDKVVQLNSTYRSPDDEVKYAERFIDKV